MRIAMFYIPGVETRGSFHPKFIDIFNFLSHWQMKKTSAEVEIDRWIEKDRSMGIRKREQQRSADEKSLGGLTRERESDRGTRR